MNIPFFKALFFPYTRNSYLRQNKTHSMTRVVQKLFENRLLQGPELSVQSSGLKCSVVCRSRTLNTEL